MAHDVFISHSSKDKPAADAVCALLESDGLRCWIAPRDVQAGVSYAGAIIDAINECRAMVLIFSDAANASPQIEREIERAANRRIPLLPFRIENVTPQHGLEYFLSTPHWLDAFTPPLETHIRELARQLHALLDPKPSAGAAAVVVTPSPGPVVAPAAAMPVVATRPAASRTRSRMTTGAMAAIGAVVVGGALAVAGGTAVWLGGQHVTHAPASSSALASSAVASSAVASSASASSASAAPPASSEHSVAESSAATHSAAAEAVAKPPPPLQPSRPVAEGRTRVQTAVGQGVRVGAIRPPPPLVLRRTPPFRPPLRHPPRRPPPPPFRRHPRPFV